MRKWNFRWSHETVAFARNCRRSGMSDQAIDRALGISRGSTNLKLRLLECPEARDRRRTYNQNYRKRVRGELAGNHMTEQRIEIPATTLLNREIRSAAMDRRTTTQFICGDPPPGFSALDRRHVHV